MFSRKTKFFACISAIFFCFSLFIGYLSGIVIPILYSKSEAYMKTYIEKSVADAIIASDRSGVFINPISFEYDNNGNISAYTADSLSTAKLRAFISNNIIESASGESDISFHIASGTLSGIPFLYGKGPQIRIQLKGINLVTFDTSSEFTDSGINQTLHKIALNIKAKSTIKAPLSLGKKQIIAETSIPLSETVLVGDVPEAYTVIYRAHEDDEEDINDYGAAVD